MKDREILIIQKERNMPWQENINFMLKIMKYLN